VVFVFYYGGALEGNRQRALNMPKAWNPKTFKGICKRAGGRRRYNAQRQGVRDQRQLLVMEVLLESQWQSYGFGKILARDLHVDAATISRDIRYIREWRDSLIKECKGERFADHIIRLLVSARVHPRHGYSWTFTYEEGISSLTVKGVQRGTLC
jgi:hypothetical protein